MKKPVIESNKRIRNVGDCCVRDGLKYESEIHAEKATRLPAFRVNISRIRESVTEALAEWKTSGFFREYTDHKIDHVDGMLETLEWIIPESTKEIMTPADWILIVLSIYLHDLGLLITKDEFESRESDREFQEFLKSPLIEDSKFQDFTAALDALPDAERDALRYQDYVRVNHGRRVRAWIEGTEPKGENAEAIRKVLGLILDGLDDAFKRDLASVCESHTLNEIDDREKFPVSQPYGGADETANVQYAAILLRTVDLLQITKNRAPSVSFQLINPTDPFSQIEWQRHQGVRSLRAKPARNREGAVDKKVQSNTVEVFAEFKDPDPFFGLTSYLRYAEEQLAASYSIAQRAKKETVEVYEFPWRYIDTEKIRTEGFLTESFEFELDQYKILELLTGHTLYNDSSVVLRELTQNALDAVRLQASILNKKSPEFGHVIVRWDSAERQLSVQDNGTGMTQDMIVNHLLKVGSSRYQDDKFKEKFPEFHSISRFGIGVLSAFMVSDEVEILTCSSDDELARQISLRSVHGKYLIRTFDKVKDIDQISVFPHGTRVSLKIRPSAESGDVLRLARKWLMFPRCKVTVVIDDDDPVDIGFNTPAEALQHFLDNGGARTQFRRDYEVRTANKNGVELAYVVERSDIFRDWTFTRLSPHTRGHSDEEAFLPIATCVEGVAVEGKSPGFRDIHLLSIANAVGTGSPRTNVARSTLDDTPELRRMLETVYSIYCDHLETETGRLRDEEGFSLSQAAETAKYASASLTSGALAPIKPDLLEEKMEHIPIYVVENDEGRRLLSFNEVVSKGGFYTIESPLRRSIEELVKEAPVDISARDLLGVLRNEKDAPPGVDLVCNLSQYSYANEKITDVLEVDSIEADPAGRRLKLHWDLSREARSWITSHEVLDALTLSQPGAARALSESRDRLRDPELRLGFVFPLKDVAASGLEAYGSFMSRYVRYLNPQTPLAKFFGDWNVKSLKDVDTEFAVYTLLIEGVQNFASNFETLSEEALGRMRSNFLKQEMAQIGTRDREFVEAIRSTPSRSFDPFAWDNRESDV